MLQSDLQDCLFVRISKRGVLWFAGNKWSPITIGS